MLEIRPITLKDANKFVSERHRHNGPTTGHKFSVAVYDGDKLVGGGKRKSRSDGQASVGIPRNVGRTGRLACSQADMLAEDWRVADDA